MWVIYMKIKVNLQYFLMAYVDNLDTYLGVTLVYFHNGRGE
jgi:hypothetical protein